MAGKRSLVRGGITLAVLAALAGGMVMAPAGAHVTGKFAHLKKHMRQVAKKVFNQKIGSASVANAANAANADNLDGNDSTAFETASAYEQRTANLALTGAFQNVVQTSVTTSTQSRVMAIGTLEVEGNGGGDDDAGCQIVIAGQTGPENNFTIPDTAFDQDTTSVAFGVVLPAGTHAVALQCDETGDVVVDDAELVVTAIPI